jgi:hypothetical protein
MSEAGIISHNVKINGKIYQTSNTNSHSLEELAQAAPRNPLLIADQRDWHVSPSMVHKPRNSSIVEILGYLKEVENTIARMDKYVEYCIRKYKHFKFNVKLFMKDELIAKSQYVE